MALDRLIFAPTLAEDLVHFEANYVAHPELAQEVFRSVADFRSSLVSFRKATEAALQPTPSTEEGEVAEPARLSPVSVDALVAEPSESE